MHFFFVPLALVCAASPALATQLPLLAPLAVPSAASLSQQASRADAVPTPDQQQKGPKPGTEPSPQSAQPSAATVAGLPIGPVGLQQASRPASTSMDGSAGSMGSIGSMGSMGSRGSIDSMGHTGSMGSMGHTASMASMGSMQGAPPVTFRQAIEQHATSGTSAEPNSTPMPMRMTMRGNWMLMAHGNAFLAELQQTSPRGGDKLFSTNWLMPMASRPLGPGQLTLRAMFSLEPATITGRQYPLLFQQGETAFGKPIVDGQHPHDLFMELAGLYDWELGSRTLVSFYAAPVGDPALGPSAYPHRASAAENPTGTLGHHQEDSTHIAENVVTVGLTEGYARVEVSGFHGREPDENRWNIDGGAIDSWSTRLTVQPTQNLSGQLSYGRLHIPEALFPTEDQGRTTASVMYNLPLQGDSGSSAGDAAGRGNWSSTLLWGRTRSLADNSKENSYLAESTLRFNTRNYAWLRIENAGRSNELLVGENPLPAGFEELPIGHVQAYTFGYDRDQDWATHFLPGVRTAIGAQITTYGVPQVLEPAYGTNPIGLTVFLRFRPFSGRER